MKTRKGSPAEKLGIDFSGNPDVKNDDSRV